MKVDITNTNNKYQIIYADPPWKYGGNGGTKWSPAETYYPTMSFNELKAMKNDIQNIADKDCLLFMWVVSAELDKCIEVGKSWGFEYITVAFVWHKRRANVGNYTMSGCELCLLFKKKKGKIPADRVRNPGVKQFYEEKVSYHSHKPVEFAKRINDMYPISKKIELFARDEKPGFDCWGNEV
jgi:N6-adenosine-specific RNA methylase IME4